MITTAEAAQRLGVTAQAIRKAIARGRLKAKERRDSRGKYFVISPRDLTQYASSRLYTK